MTTLRVEYSPDHRALLAFEGPSDLWVELRRVLGEASEDVAETPGAQELGLAWPAFLRIRAAVGFHVSRNNIVLELSAEAQRRLEQASRRQQELYAPPREAVP